MEASLRKCLKGGSFGNVCKNRSRVMRAVRSRGNKSTEVRLRMALTLNRISGWILHPKGFAGSPDFLFTKHRIAVFVDGCFWHGCLKCGHIPRNNRAFWKEKIRKNKQRDRATNRSLKQQRVASFRIWEHSLKSPSEVSRVVKRLRSRLDAQS